jgi:phosphoglycerate dehydrogenase-like enzyme
MRLLPAGLLFVFWTACQPGQAVEGSSNAGEAADPQDVAACPECGADLIEQLGLREAPTPVRERPGWSPPEVIVVYGGRAPIERLQAAAPGVEIIDGSDRSAVARSLAEADAVLGGCWGEIVTTATNLKWIQLPSAGAERCVGIPGIKERGILITNAQRLYGPEIAEHVVAMLLAFSRGLYHYIPAQQAGRWDRGAIPRSDLWELEGRTLLVVGLGGIGTEVARRAAALGMRVVATRRSSREGPEFVDYVGMADELIELARQADVVVNTTPLTPETTGLFDAKLFAAMQPTAYFINVGRGKSVVTEDLVAALESGGIAGAGLDVTDPEPLPSGHPLWRYPNVIITPHISGMSDRGRDRLWILVEENLRRYVAGDRMLSVVDVDRGY